MLAPRTVSGEFHQWSHFALKRGATVAVDTLCNFSMVMSGVAFIEKWRLICMKDGYRQVLGAPVEPADTLSFFAISRETIPHGFL